MGMKEFLAKRKQAQPAEPTVERIPGPCGHATEFTPTGDKNDDARREKIRTRDCADCRKARSEKEAAEGKARREARQAIHRQRNKGRLPHASTFHMVYDAEAVRWIGTLTVNGVTVERSAGSLNKTIDCLDNAYRRALNTPTMQEDGK